jgi:predicted permease
MTAQLSTTGSDWLQVLIVCLGVILASVVSILGFFLRRLLNQLDRLTDKVSALTLEVALLKEKQSK